MNYANELSTTGIMRPYWYQLVSGQLLMILFKKDLPLWAHVHPINKARGGLGFLLGLLSFRLAPALWNGIFPQHKEMTSLGIRAIWGHQLALVAPGGLTQNVHPHSLCPGALCMVMNQHSVLSWARWDYLQPCLHNGPWSYSVASWSPSVTYCSISPTLSAAPPPSAPHWSPWVGTGPGLSLMLGAVLWTLWYHALLVRVWSVLELPLAVDLSDFSCIIDSMIQPCSCCSLVVIPW